METENSPFESIRIVMVDTLEKSRKATQSYVDLLDRTMRSLPCANETRADAFRAYIERQVAANHAFVDKLLHARNFQEAWRMQGEYFQLQLKAAAEEATKLDAKLAHPFRQSAH